MLSASVTAKSIALQQEALLLPCQHLGGCLLMLQGQGNKWDKGQTRYKVYVSPRKDSRRKLLEGLKLLVKGTSHMHRDLLPLSAALTSLVGRNGMS